MKDRFIRTSECVKRLYDTWLQHKSLLVSCDFDETIFDFHQRGDTYPRVITLLKQCQNLGLVLVLFTASAPKRYPEMKRYAKQLGLNFVSINRNPFPLKYGNHGKIFYNIFLDDKAGLKESCKILSLTLKKINSNLKKQ